MVNEIWVPVIGYEDGYSVSSHGRVFSNKTKKVLIPSKSTCGYHHVSLSKNNKAKTLSVHRIVACSFNKLPIYGREAVVCHKDDNRTNNALSNLFIGTQKDNLLDASKKGRVGKKSIKHSRETIEYVISMNGLISAVELSKKTGISNGHISRIWLKQARAIN